MGKRGNALMILGVLAFDVMVCVGWYATLFPLKPVTTIETVWNTVFAFVVTIAGIGLSYIGYDSCISED